jgi:Leucine-rich repeat (LRR) protein
LDVEPSNATTTLYEEIKAWEPGAFPDQELPQITDAPTNPELIAEPDAVKNFRSYRKIPRRSLLWLIAASLIFGIGSMYGAGLIKRLRTMPEPGELGIEQIPLIAGSSIDTLPPTVTEGDTAEIASTATQVPTSSVVSTSTQTTSNAENREADLQALTALYQQTGGTNWENADGWLSERSPCEWYGITCRGEKIIGLEMDSNQLGGTIPAEIGQLADLETLDLGNNQLDGNIPPELGDLSRLKHLILSGNRELSGPIPAELGNLSNLEVLELAHWESGGSLLSGEIPPELGNLKKLRSLSISVSLLNGHLPVELLSLTNLEDLHLDSNRLSGSIPPEIGNMTSLGALDLGGNDLEGPIPPELGNLAMLYYLALGGSLVTGEIPDELGNLVRLRHLVLDHTGLSGPLPLSLMNLNLRELTYFGTGVCEPADEAFQVWLDTINDLQSSGNVCPRQDN